MTQYFAKGYLVPKTNGLARKCDVDSVVRRLKDVTNSGIERITKEDSGFEVISFYSPFCEKPEELKACLLSLQLSGIIEAGTVRFLRNGIQYESFEYAGGRVTNRYWNMM